MRNARTRPDHVIADKGYSSRAFRAHLRQRGISRTIPERGGQPTHTVARHRHYDNRARSYLAVLAMASILGSTNGRQVSCSSLPPPGADPPG
ncbi:hypothetical protein GCM10012275_20790 [Longimycelium tulufanense]|uniref:Transposase n=1 Tax=Longimycelium tulufanense TaxID=907463 RepID=A0A8J3CER2_9PSEU|nr:hypothetical protein GCM10012275_20790 [Longimycelium tulufanense]